MTGITPVFDRLGTAARKRLPVRLPRLRALAVTVGVVVGALLTASITSVPFLSGVGTETTMTPGTLLAVAVAGQAAFALVGYLYVRRYLPETVCRLPTREEGRLIVAGVAVTTALAFGLEALGQAAGFAPMVSLIEEVAATDPTVLLAMALVSLVVVGPAEELLFRGAIQNRLGRTFGPLAAITVTSLLFTVVHSNNYDAGLMTVGLAMGIIFGVSSVIGVLYERTNNLAVPILVHGLYDTVVFLVLYGSAVGWI